MSEQRCPVCHSLVKTSALPIIIMMVVIFLLLGLFLFLYVRLLLAEKAHKTCTNLCRHHHEPHTVPEVMH